MCVTVGASETQMYSKSADNATWWLSPSVNIYVCVHPSAGRAIPDEGWCSAQLSTFIPWRFKNADARSRRPTFSLREQLRKKGGRERRLLVCMFHSCNVWISEVETTRCLEMQRKKTGDRQMVERREEEADEKDRNKQTWKAENRRRRKKKTGTA